MNSKFRIIRMPIRRRSYLRTAKPQTRRRKYREK